MLKNYLIATLRSQLRNKAYFLINLAGLTLGVACSFAIYLWVQAELRVDHFHRDHERMALVRSSLRESDGAIVTYEDTQGVAAGAALGQIPEVENACRLIQRSEVLISVGENSITESGLAADTSFFHLFTFPIVAGDARHPLNAVNVIAISQSMARRFFGNEEAVGKSLKLDGIGNVEVTAVFEDVPRTSSIQFDFVTPLEPYIVSRDIKMAWSSYSFMTYVTLRTPFDFNAASEKFEQLVKNNYPGDDGAEWLFLQRFDDVYLHSRFVGGESVGGRIEYVQLFTVAGVFLLFVACVNFVNLATARAGRRCKEVGVRKVNGARKTQLVVQFLVESFGVTFCSVLLAVVLLQAALPGINLALRTQLAIDFYDRSVLITLFGTWIVTSLAAGLYPAFVLSNFQPSKTLRGGSNYAGNPSLRKMLVAIQFALSALLLVTSAAIFQQVQFIQKKNLGLNRDHVLYFRSHEVSSHMDALRQELQKEPAVISIGVASRNPLSINNATTSVSWPGMPSDAIIQFRAIEADYEFMNVIQLPIVKGRGFSRAFPASDTVQQFIITEEAAKRMQLRDPIGMPIVLRKKPGEIVGVAADFHSRSLHSAIDPVIFTLAPAGGLVFAKIDGIQARQALGAIESAYRKFETTFPFEYHFLDETFERQYRSEAFAQRLVFGFACICLLVASLGLYGLALFSVERRTKEIGIRKVLGATVFHLVRLLSQETIVIVLVANVIAWPISWLVVRNWLERFAYRTEMSWWLFIGATLVTLLIATLVVSLQTARVALSNPSTTLKQE